MTNTLITTRHKHATPLHVLRTALLLTTCLVSSAMAAATITSDSAPTSAPIDTLKVKINPYAQPADPFEGWGVSLCWWANMCGHWEESRLDSLVDWLVSPTGLNFRIFRYNIGGGDDPLNAHCTPRHMGQGKGLRAEMEGFKDSTTDRWHWDRDSAQRRVMLKIKQKRPDAIFEAFSNSAPYYMTVSGCCGGHQDAWKDNLRTECYQEFAHYLVDVCRHYRDAYGIEFKTLDPFNEPMTNYWYAGGSQEGCHFDFASQTALLRVLHPILQASGLRTVISAADETSVITSVKGFEAYAQAGVLPLVGQWNTHTYEANDEARARLSALCREHGMHLWMSEVGAGGKGLDGNMRLAEKLIQDMRLLRPAAWLDWQYMEDNNDQWCLVQGDFYGGSQEFHRVKNYYVRQHFSRFIPEGYTLLESSSNQLLAARSPQGDALVVVSVNRTDHDTPVCLDLEQCGLKQANARKARAYVTTSDANLCRAARGFLHPLAAKHQMAFMQPAMSITTLVIPTTLARK